MKRWQRWVAQALLAGAFAVALFAIAAAGVMLAVTVAVKIILPLVDRFGLLECILGPLSAFALLYSGWHAAGWFLKKTGVWEEDDTAR